MSSRLLFKTLYIESAWLNILVILVYTNGYYS